MSAIPPNLVGPILQTTSMQGQVAASRSLEDAQKSSAERRQMAAVDARDSTVETTDNDTQIYADAEGSGSQGRAFSEPGQEQDAKDETGETGSEGTHIDFEA